LHLGSFSIFFVYKIFYFAVFHPSLTLVHLWNFPYGGCQGAKIYESFILKNSYFLLILTIFDSLYIPWSFKNSHLLYFIYILFWRLFCATRVWTQGFPLARQVLYWLRHASNFLFYILFNEKCKNDTCWNCSRNWKMRGWRRKVEGVNSNMICFIYCKNLCKCYSIPPSQHNNKGKK
jgi:hypothetical protein